MNALLRPLAITVLVCISSILYGQDNTIRPQLWNNFYLVWPINEKLIFSNAFAYNVLLSKDYPWNEYSYSGAITSVIKPWLSASGGLYMASTRQTADLRSQEVRPFAAIGFSTSAGKRWLLSNASRIEWRNLWYSEGKANMTFRFRNRTNFLFSLIREELGMDKNLSVLLYFEAFHNFDDDVVERFFTNYKYKVGFLYRHSFKWRFELGVIYQEAQNNTANANQLPVNLITNYIIDWGIAYFISSRKD